jgi:hypothetical protein
MSTVTVPRADLTTEEVLAVLRDGLGAGYNVLPGMAMGRTALQGPHKGRPRGGQTELRISPGGITLDRLVNTFGVARAVRRVLASSPGLSAR